MPTENSTAVFTLKNIPHDQFIALLYAKDACSNAINYVLSGAYDFKQALENCPTQSWLFWAIDNDYGDFGLPNWQAFDRAIDPIRVEFTKGLNEVHERYPLALQQPQVEAARAELYATKLASTIALFTFED